MTSEYLVDTNNTNYQASSIPLTTDFEGETKMGGMKIDLNALAAMVSKINTNSVINSVKGLKPAASWLTEAEVVELREKILCLRCKKSGHQSRFCQLNGPP
ncbi:hypothetical protein GcM3_121022, partial [Golovinomyces cichoracearum]